MRKVWLGSARLDQGRARIVGIVGRPPPYRLVVVSRVEHRFVAYWNVCRHLPLPLDGGEGELPLGPSWVCSTHGARFRVSDGLCTRGPCVGERLFALPIEEQNGQLYTYLGLD